VPLASGTKVLRKFDPQTGRCEAEPPKETEGPWAERTGTHRAAHEPGKTKEDCERAKSGGNIRTSGNIEPRKASRIAAREQGTTHEGTQAGGQQIESLPITAEAERNAPWRPITTWGRAQGIKAAK